MFNAVRTPDCYCNGHPTVTAMDTRLLLQWTTSVHTGPSFKRLITSVQGCSPRTPDCCHNELLMSNAVRTLDLFARDCYSVKQSAILPSPVRMSSSSGVFHISLASAATGTLGAEKRTPRTLLGCIDIVAQTSTFFSPPGKNR